MELGKNKGGLGYLIKWIIRLGDIISINLAFFILHILIPVDLYRNEQALETFLLINLAYFVAAALTPIYLENNIIFFDKIIQRSLAFITLYYIIFSAGILLFRIENFDLSNWLTCYLVLALIYLIWHITFRSFLKWYRRKGYNYKRVVIVGDSNNAISIYHELKSSVYGYKVLGLFGNNPKMACDGLNYLGTINDIERYCIENQIDEIYCTLPNNQETEVIRLVNFSERNMIRFFLIPDFYGYIKRKLVLSSLQSIPVIAIRPEPLQKGYNRIIKRTFDILFSTIVMVTVLPIVYLIFGLLIKLTSKGPVLFKQERTGLQGKAFTCYKFRTMIINEGDNTSTTSKSDPRITRLGAFMRRTSIDELPQFFNVLMGNMSVVGPRPHMVKQTDIYQQLIDKFMIRHLIKPGITGWAQISGYRGETRTVEQMESRFKRDVWYIENWSFTLDIKIIAVTIYQVLKGDENVF
ncbi:undecaprenyl-phosphate glucose phosphotransferase [Dysgonomonas macrotermitis]|uniref:Putative colanic acid biosysnthesis UDP-glucose lipid carrier transferase n=1 Tax=Dysgonomonas macrotermitis TaxID=1346286 RepID=A0A1M5JDV8_9BACT|nr:undecaprenyl-phosphate glucose phosphotransferase [Dysgonomonas macrotermitis]SHG38752.1 putative colanic acid biosysnthesis UDP-glucose lipid carrier transferase [Dysgonomonas macrotermitis]